MDLLWAPNYDLLGHASVRSTSRFYRTILELASFVMLKLIYSENLNILGQFAGVNYATHWEKSTRAFDSSERGLNEDWPPLPRQASGGGVHLNHPCNLFMYISFKGSMLVGGRSLYNAGVGRGEARLRWREDIAREN